jgi:transposase
MTRPIRVDLELATQAQIVVIHTDDVESLRCALAVLLPAVLGATLEETALLLGVSRASVPRLQGRLRQMCTQPEAVRPSWGGRRRASLSEQEEKDFLAQWEGTSETGEVLIAAPLRSALAQRLGRPVAASVVYRMLARHGWRKVAPDTRHPKSNALIQEEWKKNFPKHWQPS